MLFWMNSFGVVTDQGWTRITRFFSIHLREMSECLGSIACLQFLANGKNSNGERCGFQGFLVEGGDQHPSAVTVPRCHDAFSDFLSCAFWCYFYRDLEWQRAVGMHPQCPERLAIPRFQQQRARTRVS